MTNEQFRAESYYRVSMEIVKALFKQELINKREYEKIDTIMIGKYQPILGGLQI